MPASVRADNVSDSRHTATEHALDLRVQFVSQPVEPVCWNQVGDAHDEQ